jgi:PIN domain
MRLRRQRLFLDANVLVNAQVRDLILRMAEADLIDIRWSDRVLLETARALSERLGVNASHVERLIGHMTTAFPEAIVGGFKTLEAELHLPDDDDRHVLAAAIHSECDLLVTNNVRDFPDDIADEFAILIASVDDCVYWLASEHGEQLTSIISQQIADMHRPTTTIASFLDRLQTVAPRGAIILGATLGDERYTELFADMVDANRADSPQAVVMDLIQDLTQTVPADDLLNRIDRSLAVELTQETNPTATQMHVALRQRLAEVVREPSEWGYVTRKRLHGPDSEVVKVVRRDQVPGIIWKPMLVRAHVFLMHHDGSTWQLQRIDDPEPDVTPP